MKPIRSVIIRVLVVKEPTITVGVHDNTPVTGRINVVIASCSSFNKPPCPIIIQSISTRQLDPVEVSRTPETTPCVFIPQTFAHSPSIGNWPRKSHHLILDILTFYTCTFSKINPIDSQPDIGAHNPSLWTPYNHLSGWFCGKILAHIIRGNPVIPLMLTSTRTRPTNTT